MKIPVNKIAELQFGLYTKPKKEGQVAYLQAKQFDDSGRMIVKPDTYINIGDSSHLLKEGNILFVGKGFRHFAWVYNSDVGAAVASSIFFVIKPDTSKILPDYLAAIFNLPDNQVYFQQLGAGSSIPNIRKSELGEFKVPLISMENQRNVVKLYNLHQREMELTHSLLEHKNTLYQSVISKITS